MKSMDRELLLTMRMSRSERKELMDLAFDVRTTSAGAIRMLIDLYQDDLRERYKNGEINAKR